MIIDPAKTALILLGASHFPNYSDLGLDRRSFSSAYGKVRKYFLESDFGPYLYERNVLDRFDSEKGASDQIDEVAAFLRNDMSLEDVFFYIVTHGTIHKDVFHLMVRTSCDNPDSRIRSDTYIDFENLYQVTLGSGSPRVYFIVDACHSGAIHAYHGDQVLSNGPSIGWRGWNGKSGRRGSAAILTANSSEELGPVDGGDEEPPPWFTSCLLEVLEKGVKGGFPYGLSLETLAYRINKCYERKLLDLNRSDSPKRRPDFLKRTTRAAVSDRGRNKADGESRRLSSTPVFLNNHPDNVQQLFREGSSEKAQRKMAMVKNEELTTEKKQLQKENEELTTEKKQLRKENAELTTEKKQLQAENAELTTEKEQLQKENAVLTARSQLLQKESRDLKEESRTANQHAAELTAQQNMNETLKRVNWSLLWLVCFMVVLTLAVCALVLAEPELLESLVSWI